MKEFKFYTTAGIKKTNDYDDIKNYVLYQQYVQPKVIFMMMRINP